MDLNLLEKKAIEEINKANYLEAIDLLNTLVRKNPFYEHGKAFYNLASCYEEIGDFDNAEMNYLKALEISPQNSYFLGGYASFLFLFRQPKIAFEYYLKLLKVEDDNRDVFGKKETMLGLYQVGKRLGLSQEKVNKISLEYLRSN